MSQLLLPHDLEQQILAFRRQVLNLAAQDDIDSGVVIAALADVVAITAAVLDHKNGQRTLNDRMQSFCHRVEEVYERLGNNSGALRGNSEHTH